MQRSRRPATLTGLVGGRQCDVAAVGKQPLVFKPLALCLALVLALASACAGDETTSRTTTTVRTAATTEVRAVPFELRNEAARVEAAVSEGFEQLESATSQAELQKRIDELQMSADELALKLDSVAGSAEQTQQKGELSGLLRVLSGRLRDVEADVSQVPDIETARKGEALLGLEELRVQIETLAHELQR